MLAILFTYARRRHVVIWHVLAACVTLAAVAAVAHADIQVSPVTSISPVVLTAHVTVDGVPFEARPLYYPPDTAGPISGDRYIRNWGDAQHRVGGDKRDHTQHRIFGGRPAGRVAVRRGDAGRRLGGRTFRWCTCPTAISLKGELDGNAAITLTYGRTAYMLDGVNDIATIVVGGPDVRHSRRGRGHPGHWHHRAGAHDGHRVAAARGLGTWRWSPIPHTPW